MPSQNIVKTYVENGYYHIYNRGVEKREIFLDEQDCKVFLHYIKLYLSSIEELSKTFDSKRIHRFLRLNLSSEINLLSFALMPNHFHFQLQQVTKDGIIKFMRRLMTSYVMYFNKKYKRVGSLFQNKYKAVLVETEDYLLELSRYIHRNSFSLDTDINFLNFSSYPYYLEDLHASWIKPHEVLSYFSQTYPQLSYKSFVEKIDEEPLPFELVIEEE